MAESSCSSQSPSFLNGLMMGVIAGAAGYFLLGTKKGARVKKQLLKKLENGWGEVEDVLDETGKAGQKLARDVKKIRRTIEKDTAKIERQATKEINQVQEKVAEVKQTAETVGDNLATAARKIERRFFLRNGRSLGK